MFQLKGDNLFEEKELPKSFYFPTLEKPLSINQRKTCLSPDKMEGHPKHTQSKEDAKFLRGSNKLSTHEVPTREDGTFKHDSSSGSQFNESWPSTDKNVSSLSHYTPPSTSTPAESGTLNKENRDTELAGKDNMDEVKPSSQSTLSKYIERFRHGAPVSREHRGDSHSTNKEDFWWLSPPTSTSTPNQPTESTVSSKYSPSTTTETSPKLRRKKFNKASSDAAPLQKSRFLGDRVSRPLRQLVDAMDSDTADLQTRADLLLEKSESTLSDVSTPESIPKRPSSWMLQKQRRQEIKQEVPVTRIRPAPEDDILYQWRLSRRLEKAQEQAKSSWAKPFSDITAHRSAVPTRYMQSSVHTRSVNFPGNVSEVVEERQKANEIRKTMKISETTGYDLSSTLTTEKTTKPVPDNGERNTETTTYNEVIEPAGRRLTTGANDKRKDCVSRIELPINENNGFQNTPLGSDVPAVCFIGDTNLPSHVHMMCDIVPCMQNKEYLEPKGNCTVVTKEHPTHSAVNSCSRTPCDSPLKTIKQIKISERFDKQEPEGPQSPPFSPIVNKCSSSASILPDKIKKTCDIPETPRTTNDCLQQPDNGNMIGAVIGQVISERLFSSISMSRASSPTISISNECPDEEDEEEEEEEENKSFEKKNENGKENVDGKENAKSELKDSCEHDKQLYLTAINTMPTFPNDKILIRLREQADIYREHLRNIDALLETLAD